MKNLIAASFVTLLVSMPSFAQDKEDTEVKDRDLKIEIEPASFFLKGAAGSVAYNITKDNAFSLGLYSASLDVPGWAKPYIFDNVYDDINLEDTSDVRLGFELALMARYKFDLFKEWESDPYVGLIVGWEYFDVTPRGGTSVRLSTIVATPYIGYEFYFFKQMLYVNPQLRGVFYFGQQTSDSARPEAISSFFMLPQISLGIRI